MFKRNSPMRVFWCRRRSESSLVRECKKKKVRLVRASPMRGLNVAFVASLADARAFVAIVAGLIVVRAYIAAVSAVA